MPYERGQDPSPSFRFAMEIEGIQVARFADCSGLEFEQETFDYKEGGMNSHVHRFPGRFKFTNLTLKKGIAVDGQTLWDWARKTVQGEITTRNVTLTLYDYTGQKPLRTWVFRDAFPVKWNSTSLSAEQNAVAFETLTLAHQGMDFAQ